MSFPNRHRQGVIHSSRDNARLKRGEQRSATRSRLVGVVPGADPCWALIPLKFTAFCASPLADGSCLYSKMGDSENTWQNEGNREFMSQDLQEIRLSPNAHYPQHNAKLSSHRYFFH